MASMPRIILRDHRLGTHDALLNLNPSYTALPRRKLINNTHLDVRSVFDLHENGRSCAIRSELRGPLFAAARLPLVPITSKRCSTIRAIIMTPLLTKLLAGQLVPVDAAGLAISTFQVVLVPTVLGVLANEFFPKFTSKIIMVTPLIGVILTTLLCASPIGQVSEVLKTQGAQLILPVLALHAAAFALDYWISKISFGESTSRTISIECGMQFDALVGVLPFQYLRQLKKRSLRGLQNYKLKMML